MLSKYAGQPWSSVSVLLPGVVESMSTHIVLSLLLFFSTSPHQVLDANPQTSETEQFGTWGYSVCTCVCVCLDVYVCVCVLTHFHTGRETERGRAVKVLPPSFLFSTSADSPSLPRHPRDAAVTMATLQQWADQTPYSRAVFFFFLSFLSSYTFFFSLLFVSSRLCHGSASRCCLYNYKDPYLLIYLVCLHWDFAQQ